MKKIIIPVILFLFFASPARAATFPDVPNGKFTQAIDVLSELKIMVGDVAGTFRPADTVKRSEFAAIAIRLAGLDSALPANSPTKFPDVVSNHWANSYINLAVEKGYLVGDKEGTFRPDASISIAETATILVRLTGRDSEAIQKGGYPDGYITIAQSLNILQSDVFTTGGNVKAPITRGNIALCAWRALDSTLK